ncbi:uncharacterized protein LOC133284985 [Gastrolobium bilobum]|uniref:uncharacterized protein LOC133284985 n=1 Tax=Gastrolobium bilobum TaxID=150636 RepID=UPI002AAF6B2F|nr:uncharacterized protein LOC133284985 [Gastrolobium bilobum]
MSSNLQTVRALIYYNGRKVMGRRGVTFEGEKRPMRITRGTTFAQLKANIHQKLGLQGNQRISEVTVRAFAGNSEYTAISITDDDDVDIILDIFVEQAADTSSYHTNGRKFVEIYVNFENTDDLSVPQRSLDLNTTPVIDYLNRHASSSILPDAPNSALFDDVDMPTYDRNDDDEEEEDEDACLAADINDDDSASEDDDHHNPSDMPIGFQSNVNESTSTGIVGYENMVQGDNVTPNVGPNVTPFWNGISHYSYINYEYLNEDREYNEREYHGAWAIGDELFVKQEFESKESVQMAVKSYCMKINKEAIVVESTTMKLVLRCRNHESGCPWRMRAMKPKNGLMWVVSRWEGPHNCVTCNLSQDQRQLDSAFISSTILEMVKEEPHVSIGLIQERIRNNYGFTISYRKAWKAKQKAMAKIYDDWDQSYAYLPRWLNYMLTFSEGWKREVLPLAFAVVEGETKESWEYFLSCIRLYVTQKTGICLISDRHRGILSAVANPYLDWQPPKAYHVRAPNDNEYTGAK